MRCTRNSATVFVCWIACGRIIIRPPAQHMRSSAIQRLVGAVVFSGLVGTACSDDCPNCPGSPASVVISPTTSSVLVNRELQLVALVYDKNGNLLSGHVATWSSDDDNVASVDAD